MQRQGNGVKARTHRGERQEGVFDKRPAVGLDKAERKSSSVE